MLVPNVVFTLYFLSKVSLERTLVLNEDCELVFTVLEYFLVTVTATSLFPLTYAFNAVYSTTFETDKKFGTNYHKNFVNYAVDRKSVV